MDRASRMAGETAEGKAVCATPRGSRYPYVYPRDNAQCARALGKLVTYSANPAIVDRAFTLLEEIAGYLLSVQRPDGYWGQRYDVDGHDRGIYRQEEKGNGEVPAGNMIGEAALDSLHESVLVDAPAVHERLDVLPVTAIKRGSADHGRN